MKRGEGIKRARRRAIRVLEAGWAIGSARLGEKERTIARLLHLETRVWLLSLGIRV